VFIKLAEELPGSLVVSDLSELEGNTTAAVLWEAFEGVERVTDSVENSILRFTSRLTVGDGDD
jgi:hypothetical protein